MKRKKKFLNNYKNYLREDRRSDANLFDDDDTWNNDRFWDQAEQEDLKRRINQKTPDNYNFEDDEEENADETDALLWNAIKQNREETQKKFQDDFGKSQSDSAVSGSDVPFPEANFNISDPIEQEEEEEGNLIDPFEPNAQSATASTTNVPDVEKNEDLENLCYLIRSLFKKSDIDSDAEYAGMDIKVYVYPEKTEKMQNLLKIFNVIKKLKNELLVRYDVDIELYQNKAHSPVFLINFDFLDEDDEDIEVDEVDLLQKKVKDLTKSDESNPLPSSKPIGLGRTANMPENDFIGETGKLIPVSQGTGSSNYNSDWDAHSENKKNHKK